MHQSQYRKDEQEYTVTLSASVSIAELYHHHARTLFTYLRMHLPEREDAEDVLAEVFVSATKSEALLQQLSGEQQRLWLWRVAHNEVADYHRRKKRRPISPLEEDDTVLYEDERLEPEQMITRSEEIAELLKHIRQLSEMQQQILYLRFVAGLPSVAIAAQLGKQDGAIRTILSRTLNRLRGIYEKTKEFPHG